MFNRIRILAASAALITFGTIASADAAVLPSQLNLDANQFTNGQTLPSASVGSDRSNLFPTKAESNELAFSFCQPRLWQRCIWGMRRNINFRPVGRPVR